jgi:hypothetical protein
VKTNQPAVIITGSGKIAATINGVSYVVETDHPKYQQALNAVRQGDWDSFVNMVNISQQVQGYFNQSGVKIKDGLVTYNGEVIHNTLTKRIINFMRDELPYEPLVKFFDNLMQNPSSRAVNELYDFLEAGELPITEDGCFLAFKNVRSNYMDIHSNSFRNQVGDVCEMPRNRVDEDKDRTCSYGLHFCSIAYLPHFSDSGGGHTMIVKINPKDVVAIPADYNNTKGRTCRYEVVSEYKEDWRSKLNRNESGWDSNLYSSDGGEYDWDDDDDEDWDVSMESTWSDKCYDDDKYGCGNSCDHNDECSNSKPIYGVKPNGHKFWAVRNSDGKFTKKEI